MYKSRFTSEEIAVFSARFAVVPAWSEWQRLDAPGVGEVIEIQLQNNLLHTLRLAKLQDGRFAATGFDNWALTVCDDLTELLDVVARMAPSAPAHSEPDERTLTAA